MLKKILNIFKQTINYIVGSKTNYQPTRYYDLTRAITSDVAVFPGDLEFKVEYVFIFKAQLENK